MGRLTNKKGKSLNYYFLKYMFGMVVADVILMAIMLVFVSTSMANNVIYPANHEERLVENVLPSIAEAEEITKDLIPDLCEYGVYDLDLNYISGNLSEDEAVSAAYAINYSGFSYRGKYYKVIPRTDGYCIVQYDLEPQFKSEKLRSVIKHPQNMFGLLMILVVVFNGILFSVIFSKKMRGELSPILEVSEKVRNKDLDFTIQNGKIREINEILEGMDKMRQELGFSLKTQWQNEENRKRQIGELAHDLKTPLSVVKGNTEILLETVENEGDRECLNYMDDATRRMEDYILRLIEINKSTETAREVREEVCVDKIYKEISNQTMGLCLGKGVKAEFDFAPLKDNLFIDENQYVRAVMNIISNGIDYSPKDSVIRIVTKSLDDSFSLIVEDSGAGFSKEDIKYATDRFYMGDGSRSGGNHFGMGLYEASEVAKQYGGRLILSNSPKTSGGLVELQIKIKR